MRHLHTALILSLIIHIVGAIILLHVRGEGAVREGYRAVFVDLNVKAPEPRLLSEKPKINPVEINHDRRTTARQQFPKLVKIDRRMDRRTAYQDIIVTRESEAPDSMEFSEGDTNLSDLLPTRSGVSGARRNVRGGQSQLVEFVSKSRGKRKVIYCMDVSASMGAANKLNLARNYLKDSLLSLDSSKDEFNVIAFAQNARIFRPGGVVPATKQNLAAAMGFLDEYTPQNIEENRKTNLLSPLLKALEMGPSIIALVTDGLPTSGETNPEVLLQRIREENNGKIGIFAIGMEMDMDQQGAWLLKAIANQNNGEFQFL
jgi:hypothetical protein